jgi:hypothetical protein
VKNAYFWMNVSLATQQLLASTAAMIQNAIDDNEILLNLCEKGMYGNICDLCIHWSSVVDICNGQDRPHSPVKNVVEQQTQFMQTMNWFPNWRALHNKRVRDECASKFIFFADKTLFCIKSLLPGHVTGIKIFCIGNGKKITPRTMNTDTIEWHFRNARQMVDGSTNKLTAASFDSADKKASTFNAANMAINGNNV